MSDCVRCIHVFKSTAVDCGSLMIAVPNGQVYTSSGTTFMMTATYTCNTGYTLIGANTRTCGGDGSWTPDAPTCARTQVINNINCMLTVAVYNSFCCFGIYTCCHHSVISVNETIIIIIIIIHCFDVYRVGDQPQWYSNSWSEFLPYLFPEWRGLSTTHPLLPVDEGGRVTHDQHSNP